MGQTPKIIRLSFTPANFYDCILTDCHPSPNPSIIQTNLIKENKIFLDLSHKY